MSVLDDRQARSLRAVLTALAALGVVPNAAQVLKASMPQAGGRLEEAVLTDVPAFRESGNPEILRGLRQHGGEHVQELFRLISGAAVSDFAFVKAHARLRAGQRFPLEAILHAYRCGHRVLSHWLRDAAVAVKPGEIDKVLSAIADFSIEYTNTISAIATSEYVAHVRVIVESESDLRTELLNILLSGYDESDARVAGILRRAGYLEQRQSYCVVVARSANPAEMERNPRAQRVIGAIGDVVSTTSLRILAGMRDSLATVVVSDRRRQSGWTSPQTSLAQRLHSLLLELGPAVVVGVSSDHPSTSFIPRALAEARTALDFAGPAHRVVAFGDLPVRSLLVHRGASQVQATPPVWSAEFHDADAKLDGALVKTLQALGDADMNIQKAAKLLGKHPNTVYARIERIRELTGLDVRRYHDLTELLLSTDCWRV